MSEQIAVSNDLAIGIISKALAIPGIKVDREKFLLNQFKDDISERKENLIELGPIEAGYSREELNRRARRLINSRTLETSGISFAAGLPGGLAMAGTIPADTLQFYAFALRMAQELAYLYGEDTLWNGTEVDETKVMNQLLLYCGVMFGVSGSSATLKVVSSALSKQVAKNLPNKALTKTIYYPIIKQIAKNLGYKMTKDSFAKGVSKTIPVVGGIASGGITFATMRPMGMRLIDCFDEVCFSYSKEDYEADFKEANLIADAIVESSGVMSSEGK